MIFEIIGAAVAMGGTGFYRNVYRAPYKVYVKQAAWQAAGEGGFRTARKSGIVVMVSRPWRDYGITTKYIEAAKIDEDLYEAVAAAKEKAIMLNSAQGLRKPRRLVKK